MQKLTVASIPVLLKYSNDKWVRLSIRFLVHIFYACLCFVPFSPRRVLLIFFVLFLIIHLYIFLQVVYTSFCIIFQFLLFSFFLSFFLITMSVFPVSSFFLSSFLLSFLPYFFTFLLLLSFSRFIAFFHSLYLSLNITIFSFLFPLKQFLSFCFLLLVPLFLW